MFGVPVGDRFRTQTVVGIAGMAAQFVGGILFFVATDSTRRSLDAAFENYVSDYNAELH